MKTLVTIICLHLIILPAFAQNTAPCQVLSDSLKGTYEGGCLNGKADGEGKASGVHSYEGGFKNGLPDGMGTYTWKNGNRFTGNWKKGLKEGKGTYYIRRSDSTITGFWKKDIYKGEYEKAYEIINVSNSVSHHEFSKLSAKGNTVTVTIQSGIVGGAANVDDFQVMYGSYDKHNKRETSDKIRSIEFQGVQFPFKLRFGTGSLIEFVINEPGEWLVDIHL